MQEQLKKEIKTNQSLHQMIKSLTLQNDSYSAAFIKLKNHLTNHSSDESLDQSSIVDADEAHTIVDDILNKLNTSTHCQCDRWKNLFSQESQEAVRLSLLCTQLQNNLSIINQQRQQDRIQIKKLLEDYLEEFKKGLDIQRQYSKQEPKKKQNRSNSKSKHKNSAVKQSTPKVKVTKEQYYGQMIIDMLQRDALQLHNEIELLRKENIQREAAIRIYRQRQRNRILQQGR